MKIKAIITGSTGMVGEGVLHECLKHPDVESVLVINRHPCGVQHEKLIEIIHADFYDISSIKNQLSGYNACYFCLGVSSVGMKEDAYRHVTYDLTMHVARTLAKINPKMTFCYVSGAGTDSTEQGKTMWARVKGKTENDLLKLPFKAAYMFRPGLIQPTKGLNNAYRIYKIFRPIIPALRRLFPNYVCTLEDVGNAMIHVVMNSPQNPIIENQDISNYRNL
ncbi:NAD-dependent epimerase/dehydratase family protein [candidate division KSB1 bacterium]|nr:NAD-dependent epimerase/dehydratase family protein [candidate division KSB1 bacterium]